jgi:integrase/recombinase XerC
MLTRDRYLSDPEVTRLLRVARERAMHRAVGIRDHLLLAILVNTGIRPGEALALVAGDFVLADHSPMMRVRRLKKRRERGVLDDLPISRTLGRAVRAYIRVKRLAPDALLFPVKIRRAQLMFRTLAERAGLPESVTLYSLRHTAGTRLYNATLDLRLTQEQLGHANARTTEIYTHVSTERRRRAVDLAGTLL